MRIIDKNTDFYDFYQNIYKDDALTFDRRDSFVLTKEMVCDAIHLYSYNWSWKEKKYKYDTTYLLLQICNTYWLFTLEVTEVNNSIYTDSKPTNYSIKLITKWRNSNKSRKLCSVDIVRFYYSRFYKDNNKNVENFINRINTNDYKNIHTFNHHIIYNGDIKIEKHIPLLKACGITECVDPLDIYLAFEEYFSLEKTASERREPIGTTDIDKVESHGFDKKTSFRGK